MSEWTDHVAKWRNCQLCPLGRQRSRICLARGTVPADVLFVGEAPGASEDAVGQPFVGPAGRLLDQIIERAVPPTVRFALTNLVACFPAEAKGRGDNEPSRAEVIECRPRLVEFFNLSRPRLVVCVGALSAAYVSSGREPPPVPCVDVVHPAAILRMPLAQKQMATQKAIVVIRNAVEDHVVRSKSKSTRKWEVSRAEVQPYAEDDIPF